MAFKDHFSGHASSYARYRPDYPAELFAYLATLTPRHESRSTARRAVARPLSDSRSISTV